MGIYHADAYEQQNTEFKVPNVSFSIKLATFQASSELKSVLCFRFPQSDFRILLLFPQVGLFDLLIFKQGRRFIG